jgi:hypothetical protein
MSNHDVALVLVLVFACIAVITLAAHVGGSIKDDQDPDGGPF